MLRVVTMEKGSDMNPKMTPIWTYAATALRDLAVKCLNSPDNYGAGEGIRTLDPNLGKVVLYH